MDQGSNKNHSPAYNFTPTVTKFCVMWEGLSLPHDTKFGNCRCKIVDSRSFHSWSLIHGLRWSGLIKVGPGGALPGCGSSHHCVYDMETDPSWTEHLPGSCDPCLWCSRHHHDMWLQNHHQSKIWMEGRWPHALVVSYKKNCYYCCSNVPFYGQ